MNKFSYVPILKTGQSERLAIENLTEEVKDIICPLFELTRSRRSKNFPGGDIVKSLESITNAYGVNRPFILDVTSLRNLSNFQIDSLQSNENGYQEWTRFLIKLKQEKYPNIIPTVVSNDSDDLSDEENRNRFYQQIEVLNKNFDHFVYRFPPDYGDICVEDFNHFKNSIDLNKIIFMIDNGFFVYINDDNKRVLNSRIKLTNQIIESMEVFRIPHFIISSETFPQNPADVLDTANQASQAYCQGILPIGAVTLFSSLSNSNKFGYSDYSTVYPEPSLQEGGRGWVPRIDLPTEEKIIFGRERRDNGNENYERPYKSIANEIIGLPQFLEISEYFPCWGIEQIRESAEKPTGRTPSRWIAVRINIHITIQSYLHWRKLEN